MRAHRLAEPGVAVGVPGRAGDVAAMGAAAGVGVAAGTARQDGRAAHPAGVDRAEGGGGEGGEHARVRGDGLRDALAPGQARTDQLAGVPLVHRRARGADGLAAVAARGRRGAVAGSQLAGGQVDHVGAATEPDRMRAAAVGGELAFPAAEVAAGGGGVVGGRLRSRARDEGSGSEGGCRGSHGRELEQP
jgi:hypothetical protein